MGCGAEVSRGEDRLAGKRCGLSENGPQVWEKALLSGYHVSPVSLMQPDRPSRPNEQDRLADFFSILLGLGFAVIQMPVLPVEPGMAQFVSENVPPSCHG